MFESRLCAGRIDGQECDQWLLTGTAGVANITSIIAALDFEGGAEGVLARAVQLATVHRARLTLLHVIEEQPLLQAVGQMDLVESDLLARLERQALSSLETLIANSGYGQETELEVAFGVPHAAIGQVASRRCADLVAIGAGTVRSLGERILGSIAYRTIRTCPVPVLVVRARSSEPYRRVAAAIDFSDLSEGVAEQAHRLVPDATLQFVHATDIPAAFEAALLRAGTSSAELETYRSTLAHKARDRLTGFAHNVAGTANVAVRVLEGKAASALVHFCEAAEIDLLATGSHGRGVLRDAFIGSVTQRLVSEVSCDVLVCGNGR